MSSPANVPLPVRPQRSARAEARDYKLSCTRQGVRAKGGFVRLVAASRVGCGKRSS